MLKSKINILEMMNRLTGMKIAWENLASVHVYFKVLKEFWMGYQTRSLKGDGVQFAFYVQDGV